MSVPCLKIMPIRKMMEWVNTCEKTSIAVLVASSYNVDCAKLPDNCIVQVFDDIDYEIVGRSLSQEQARAFASYVQSLAANIDVIICACNAGESRSAALCAALCEYYGVNSDWIWDSPHYHPNMYVYDLFSKELGIEVADFRKEELFFRNRRAFSAAIRQEKKGI